MVTTSGRESTIAGRIRRTQGKRIHDARGGMNARQLAEAINELGIDGVTATPAAVSQWENGIRAPRQVMQLAIAKALDVPWLTLFDLTGEEL